MSEKVNPIKTYARKSLGSCRCRQQADTHNLLLWHLGKGKMIDYLFLSCYMRTMRSNSTTKNGLYRARTERLNSVGVQTSLTQQDLTRATNGFISHIKFHEELKVFSCPKCGTSPKYLVADGKSDGPTKRKVDHLKELGTADDDDGFLPQGSLYKDRVFLPSYEERQAVCHLLTGAQTMEDFLTEEEFESDNGQLLKNLITRISTTWQDDIPKEYERFIANKPVLQVCFR